MDDQDYDNTQGSTGLDYITNLQLFSLKFMFYYFCSYFHCIFIEKKGKKIQVVNVKSLGFFVIFGSNNKKNQLHKKIKYYLTNNII